MMMKRINIWLNTYVLVTAVALGSIAFLPVAHSEQLPDWNDEAAAYAARGLNTTGSRIHILEGQSSDRVAKFTEGRIE